jgi:O-antigen/teichoic acid export membrane protein
VSVVATPQALRGPSRSGYRVDVLTSPEAGEAVIRGGALRAGGYVVCILLTTISMPLMTRHLGVEDFGRFVTVLSLVTIVAGLSEAGLMNIGVREFATQEPGARARMMRNLIGMRAVLTLAGVAAAVVFAVIAGYPGVVIAGTGLMGAGLFVQQFQETLTIPLAASLRLGPISGLALVRQVVLVSMIVFLVLSHASLLAFYTVAVIASSAALGATIAFTRHRVPFAPAFEARTWKPLLRDVLPYAAATAMGAVVLQVIMVATSLLASERQAGYFATSFRVFEVIAAIGGVLALSAFPVLARAAQGDEQRLRYLLQRMFEIAVIGGLGVALLTFIAGGTAVRILGGSAFEAAVPVLRLQALGLPFAFLVATWGFALLALRRNRALVLANAAALGLASLLSLALIPSGGAGGAAICVLVTEVALAAMYGAALVRARPDLRFSSSVVPRALLAGGVTAAVSILVALPSLAAAGLAGIVYASALVALRAIPPEVWLVVPIRRLRLTIM